MRIGFLCMTQYPADTMIWFISMIIREACGFVGILAVAGVTGHLGDWGIYEICLLFSMKPWVRLFLIMSGPLIR